MTFVLDGSVTLTWFFEDEDNPYAILVLDPWRNPRRLFLSFGC